MAIDPSIALSANAGSGDLLRTLAGATQLRGQMMQQKSNTAMSDALQQSIDPVTGKPDIQKAMSLIAQSPDAAYNLPAFQSQMLQNQTQQVQYDTNKLELAKKTTDMLSNGLGGLLASNNLTPQAVMQLGASGVRQNLWSAQQAVDFTSDMPSDLALLPGWVKQKYLGVQENTARLQALMPQNSQVGTGNATHFVSTDPITGRPTDMGQMQQNMTPGDANTLVPFYDPATNTMRQVPKGQAAAMAGGQMPQPGAAPGAVGGSGRYPSQQSAPGGMPAASGIGLQSAPSPGASAAADVLGKGAGEAVVKLQDTASGAPDRIRFLQDMTSNLNHFESGPTSNWTAQAKALALQLAPGMSLQVGVDPQSVASKEEFTKYAAQLAMSSMKGMGPGSDMQLATTVSGNPHAELSKLGLQQIMQVMTGVERANLAKNAAWQAAGVQPQNYSKWEAAWNKDIDPRVFVTPEMSQGEVSKMYKGLKPADQARFKTSLRTAIDAGIIPNPVGQ